jgi:tRNA A37 threonylcarbamoyladenosine dehydratase
MENSVSTNFLIELKQEYEREIYTLTNILETKKEMLEKIENKLLTKCNHEWIIDYIDVEIEKTDTIKYCKHCELTYNTNSSTT